MYEKIQKNLRGFLCRLNWFVPVDGKGTKVKIHPRKVHEGLEGGIEA